MFSKATKSSCPSMKSARWNWLVTTSTSALARMSSHERCQWCRASRSGPSVSRVSCASWIVRQEVAALDRQRVRELLLQIEGASAEFHQARRLSSTTRVPWRNVITALGQRSHAAR
jgi:hypothetical protein